MIEMLLVKTQYAKEKKKNNLAKFQPERLLLSENNAGIKNVSFILTYSDL